MVIRPCTYEVVLCLKSNRSVGPRKSVLPAYLELKAALQDLIRLGPFTSFLLKSIVRGCQKFNLVPFVCQGGALLVSLAINFCVLDVHHPVLHCGMTSSAKIWKGKQAIFHGYLLTLWDLPAL